MSKNPVVVYSLKDARARVKAAKAGTSLNTLAAKARVAEVVTTLRGWKEACDLVPHVATVDDAVARWADAADRVAHAKSATLNAACEGASIEDLTRMHEKFAPLNGHLASVRNDVRQYVKEEPSLAAPIVVAAMRSGLVSPATLRKQLANAGLARSIALDIASAKAEYSAALDALAKAKAEQDAAKVEAVKAVQSAPPATESAPVPEAQKTLGAKRIK